MPAIQPGMGWKTPAWFPFALTAQTVLFPRSVAVNEALPTPVHLSTIASYIQVQPQCA